MMRRVRSPRGILGERAFGDKLRLQTAFGDPAAGTAFATQMLTANPDIDVLFQVAGLSGNGVLAVLRQ